MYAKLKPEKRITSDVQNHKIGNPIAGIAKSNVIPTHMATDAAHRGMEPFCCVDAARRPKKGSWKKSIDRKINNANPKATKLISY